AAMHLGATVAWFEDRRENLIAAPHAREQHVTLELALDDEGSILSARSTVVGDAGAYSFNAGTALTEPYLTARSMLGPYRITDYA
ncbi:molybdopterin-dependent oxidoreductase, partial [Escherichia coli]|uniref:molybdopterin cofactor-binding domain-containing protein n=1 Tax=Escherichia coli TaxID=562 RepID=UPI00256F34F2